MDSTTGIFFWGFLIVYGIVMFLLSPKTVSPGRVLQGRGQAGPRRQPVDDHGLHLHRVDLREVGHERRQHGRELRHRGRHRLRHVLAVHPADRLGAVPPAPQVQGHGHDQLPHRALRHRGRVLLLGRHPGAPVQRGVVEHVGRGRVLRRVRLGAVHHRGAAVHRHHRGLLLLGRHARVHHHRRGAGHPLRRAAHCRARVGGSAAQSGRLRDVRHLDARRRRGLHHRRGPAVPVVRLPRRRAHRPRLHLRGEEDAQAASPWPAFWASWPSCCSRSSACTPTSTA